MAGIRSVARLKAGRAGWLQLHWHNAVLHCSKKDIYRPYPFAFNPTPP